MKLSIVICILLCATLAWAQIPRTGREWYVGGNFSRVINADNTFLDVNNIARWDGSKWNTVGPASGTNGVVKAIFFDKCFNTYIAGGFTTAGGVSTGPIAKMTVRTSVWTALSPVGQTITWSAGTYVNSISVDCANIPSTTGCNCDIYLGGKFTLTINTGGTITTAINLVKWDATNNKFDALAGSGITASDEVFAVYKKDFGVTDAARILWVGGSFSSGTAGLKKWTNNNGWDTSITNVNGIIRSFYYERKFLLTDIDILWAGGNFVAKDSSGNVICVNVCNYNYKTNLWTKTGNNNAPGTNTGDTVTGVVNSISQGNFLVAGGNFVTSPDGLRNLVKIVTSNPASNAFTAGTTLSTAAHNSRVNFEVISVDACADGDLGCSSSPDRNSVAYVGVGSQNIWFYNGQSDNFNAFGNGTNGQAQVIRSLYTVGGSSSIRAQFALTALLVSALFMLLLL